MMKSLYRCLAGLLAGYFITAGTGIAADDPSIKGDLRTAIQSSMTEFIAQRSSDGEVLLYDAVAGCWRCAWTNFIAVS